MNWLKLILMGVFLFASPSATLAEQPEAVLRAGVASMITPVSAVKYYQQVVEYIGRKLGKPAKMVHRTTYDEIDVMLENKELEVAFICSSPYVLNHEKFGAELLVVPQVDGEVYYHSEIIVHKDSEIEAFEQLQSKAFVFVDPKSNSGKLYPTYLLAKQDHTPESFFSSQLYSYSHNKSVELVAKKRVDGAAVDSIVYAFMKATGSPYAEQTRVIHRSPSFGIPPVVIPPDLPFHMKASLREIFLEMHNDPEGKEILDQMRIEKFVEASDTNYDSIRAMRAFIDNSDLHRTTSQDEGNSINKTSRNVVLFGVLPRDNPILAYERYQPLMDYLTEATGIKTELHLEKSYQAVVNSLGQGKITFALLGPLTYLDAHKRYGVVPIARSRTAKGESSFRSVIVTAKESSIVKLTDLSGKNFAFGALWSTSGNLIPRYMLAWSGIHLDNLNSYQHFNYHDTIAKKVISGEVDAGALRQATAERYTMYGMRIIATSDPIPTGPVVAASQTPYPLIHSYQKALLELADNNRGTAILQKLDLDMQGGFVTTSDADYFEIRNMINDVPTTCGKDCHPKVSF
ncbi:phosphate/phosphite/phosphonate ABC transporter substrate-binding protein [Desulfopila aestuarii]|uniref:Phosphate/phosphite/phosphonate ABC transporter binding protein n=1 Tax=Desulfopila aestuarii DSM 18488 TaxID=1121416 RepID=A0A1M7YI10_9BACT|nr:phosphate/phosphite/phosphonate ABC transporter substrate-binding protein [Desulfopila aestuarii]SHO52236.1 phosphate/phosphite/phosphonate ABC transporter binding protein [Desulfopila aestuarii DSM 18488]